MNYIVLLKTMNQYINSISNKQVKYILIIKYLPTFEHE